MLPLLPGLVAPKVRSLLEDREKCGCNVTVVAQPPAKRASVGSDLSVMQVPGC